MPSTAYLTRRQSLETYFNRTAAKTWEQLTSDAPVSKIRQTVREGRDRMRDTLLSWLPTDMDGKSLLDAGCGTGALAVAAALRGADVTAVDVAESLVKVAADRAPAMLGPGRLRFLVGDMLDPSHGAFDHAVAMDSLIHYKSADIVRALASLAPRLRGSILFTFAPRTPALTAMHAVGQLFPRSDRSPAIEPVSEAALRRAIAEEPAFAAWRVGRVARVQSGFYTSTAMELCRR